MVEVSRDFPNLAVLTGYEMELSRKLKCGSDVWLNTPRITREASGTSGMTAAMNGSLNLTMNDGWIPDFGRHGETAFVLPEADPSQPVQVQDHQDGLHLYEMLEKEVIPLFYEDPKRWSEMVFKAHADVVPAFSSDRMAAQYYTELYGS